MRYYHYNGSLTTPPCTEGVKWYVMATTCRVPKSFMRFVDSFESMRGNYREVQPINDRALIGEESDKEGDKSILFKKKKTI